MIEDPLAFAVPMYFSSRPIRLRRHHARYGMGKTVVNGAVRLLARTHACEPIGHVLQR